MKTLLLLRHGKSSWKHPDLEDHDRPLKKRGKRDSPRMGRLLKEENLIPDVIVTSTARRARDTAEAAAEACGYDGEIVYSEAMYGGGPEAYLRAASDAPDEAERVLLTGHNPDTEELVHQLTGRDEIMPTAALAHIELPIDTWGEILGEPRGKLKNVWRPKELDD